MKTSDLNIHIWGEGEGLPCFPLGRPHPQQKSYYCTDFPGATKSIRYITFENQSCVFSLHSEALI